MTDDVILVDLNDQEVGTMQKMEAHQKGKLHRAFSIFVFNSKGELLIQQRAFEKYHSGGKWTNTCCSHPRPGESNLEAATRRLKEEMNMTCPLTHQFSFVYEANLLDGLSENEYDHVFFGHCDDLPVPNAYEVAAFKYISMADLEADIKNNPDAYTVWLKICFEQVMDRHYKIF